jgi:ankyrin repeat protein
MYKALLVCLFVPLLHAQSPSNVEIQDAATRAIAIVQHGSSGFAKAMPCFSCHDHALPLLALNTARERGIPVDETAAGQLVASGFHFSPDFTSIDRAVQASMIIDPAAGDGWGLVASHAAGLKPNLVTAVYARRIANWQQADGHWRTGDMRPPHSFSVFTATAVALRAIHFYLPPSMSDELRLRTDRALQWFFATQPETTEDFTFRLFGVSWGGANAVECASAAKDLLALQHADGGWSQLPHMTSDAYSTGEALVAMNESGAVAVTDPAWQKGLRYLLTTQQPDGSWHVATRMISHASVSPPYFESGFPYRHDQYISTAGTSWAAIALMLALPKSAQPGASEVPAIPAPAGIEPWMETALFGTVKELKAQLNRGLDPNSKSSEGTTLLMMSALDPQKVELLISRGAEIRTQAKSGFTALMVATTYTGTSRSVKYLLDHGAEVNPDKSVTFNASPLFFAAIAGDVDNVSLLLSRGADPNRRMRMIGMFPASPLFITVEFGAPEVTSLLVKAKADVNQKDDDGMTALHWATLAHHPEAMKALIAGGAEVNTVDRFGFTPLQYAAMVDFGDSVTVTTLLQAGADPNIKDKEGKTAFARGESYPYIAAALAGAKH